MHIDFVMYSANFIKYYLYFYSFRNLSHSVNKDVYYRNSMSNDIDNHRHRYKSRKNSSSKSRSRSRSFIMPTKIYDGKHCASYYSPTSSTRSSSRSSNINYKR